MKKKVLASMALLALLTACNDEYNDQFNIAAGITDVKNITMTLEPADYGSIADLGRNQEIALSKDPENKTFVEALNAVKANKYFTEDAPAEDYLPAYINFKYPNADAGSKFVVTYNLYQAPSAYLSDFTNLSSYDLTSEDYKEVWGSKINASYLSPTTLSKIPALLKANVTEAAEGDMMVVNYAYSTLEPSSGGSTTAEPTWTQVATIPVRSAGKDWNFVNVGPIDLSEYKGQTVNIGFKYTSTSTAAATWELKNFKALSVPYLDVFLFAKQDDGSFSKLAKKSDFKGAGEYVVAAIGADGKFYPFGRLADGKTFGYMYPKPIVVTSGVIKADAATDFVITLETTSAGFTLKNAIGQYLYQSGNYDSFNVTTTVGESGYDWTVENVGGADLFAISNVATGKTVKMNYYNGSYSYGSYAKTKIEGFTYKANPLLGDEGGFTIYNVELDDLSYVWQNTTGYGWKASAFANSVNHATESYLVSPAIALEENATLPYATIDEAFKFGAGDGSDLTVWISTDYAESSTATTKALTRASSASSNASGLYIFDGSSWSEYTTNNAKVTVVDPTVYESLGAQFIESPETVLPLFLKQKYPYATEEDKVAVVYNKTADKIVVTEYTKGENWTETTTSVPATITLTKTETGIDAQSDVYLNTGFDDNDEGGFTFQDISLSGVTYVWVLSSYGGDYYWKAGAYKNNVNNPAESWLVSPAVNLKKAKMPELNFDHAHKFLNSDAKEEHMNILISKDYSGDVTKATWETLTVTGWGTGEDWNMVNSGMIDLSAYVGMEVRIAFKYVSTSTTATQWEISKVVVREKAEEEVPAE